MNTNLFKRFICADIVRVLAIYFVILTHSSVVYVGKFNFPLSSSIAATSVPLFVMLSGALLLGKQEDYKTFYKKRLVRLILPWATWTIIYVAIKYWQNPVFEFSKILALFNTTFTSFWFLPMIAGLYILTPAIRIFVQNARVKDIAFLIIIWLLTVSLLPFVKNSAAFPLSVDTGIVRQVVAYFGYYLLGFLLLKIKLPKNKTLTLTLILSICATLIIYYLKYIAGQPDYSLSLGFIFSTTVITSTVIFAIIINLENKLDKLGAKIKSVIISLSTMSFGIYFLHTILQEISKNYLGKIDILNFKHDGGWISALILFVISYFIILGLSKLPFLKKFIT